MFCSFFDIERYLTKNSITKRVALCGAHDDIALRAVVRAKRKGFITAVLIGDQEKILSLLADMEEPAEDYEIIDKKRELASASKAIELVRTGQADIPMKGLMQTAAFLMAIQNPYGDIMDEGATLNEYTAFYFQEQDRMILAGDCAVNIAPNLEEKKEILTKLIKLAKAYQCENVKCAAVSVIEKADPGIQSSVDAAALAEMDWGENVIVEGPFALDNALDPDAAKHKGIDSAVAGHADVLLMPDIHAGNVFHKCIHFFGHMPFASGLLGANAPVIMNSRTDDVEAKYYSILSAILQTL